MSETAETLLREHLVLCSKAHGWGLVPTEEQYWAGGDGEYTIARRWYFDSDLKKRTEAFLASVSTSGSRGK